MTTGPISIPLSDGQKWRAFAVCVAVAFLTILDLTKLNVGLPSIEASLHANAPQLQFIVSGYALAYGLTLVPSGRLGDIHSRKTMFIIGLSAFVALSVLCAIAPTIEFLMFARFAQGLAAGIQMPQVVGLIQQLFQGEQRSRAFGLFGGAVGLASAFGPTFGGALILLGGSVDGWRLVFWVNVPLGIIAVIAAIRLIPSRQRHQRKHTELDLVGILLLGLSVLSLMLPFVLTSGGPGDDPRRWFILIGCAVFLTAFIFWERDYARRGKSPAVHFALFRLSSFRNGITISLLMYAAMPVAMLIIALYAQQALQLVPVVAGLITLPFALTFSIVSWRTAGLIHRYGRRMITLGIVLVIVGYVVTIIALETAPHEWTAIAIASTLVIAGVGNGLIAPPNQAVSLSEVPVSRAGVAGSVMQVGQRIGTSVGFAAVTSTFFATIHREHGAIGSIPVYDDGFRNAYYVVFGFLAAAIILAVIDMVGARKGSAFR